MNTGTGISLVKYVMGHALEVRTQQEQAVFNTAKTIIPTITKQPKHQASHGISGCVAAQHHTA